MGKINLLGGYYVEAEPNCYVLHKPDEHRVDKNGKPIKPESIGFYSSLTSAIYGFRKIYGRAIIEEYEGEMSLDKAVTETMTIHEALSELKMLDKRISAKIHGIKYCVANRHINTRIDGKTIDEYKQNVQSEYQAVTDLIRRRAAIRNALSRSNAYTTITVCGKEYTLAEAIEF